MNCFVLTLIFGSVIFSCNAVKLPSYFSRCTRNDPSLGKCMIQSGNAGLSTFIKGDPKIHVVNLNPLYVEEMYIDVNGGLQINLMKCNIWGIDTAKIRKISWDHDNKRLDAEVSVDYTSLIGEYDINGRILILPISGNGPCNITYVKPYFKFFFEYELESRKGKDYVKITNNKLSYETERTYYKLENLFNGNQQLGQTMLTFLDENWKDVDGEIGVRVGDALALVFQNILQSMFYRIPYEELFA